MTIQEVFKIASQVSTPLAIAGFIAAAFFFTLRQLISKGVIRAPGPRHAHTVVILIIERLFILSLVALVLGFVGYVLTSVLATRVTTSSSNERPDPDIFVEAFYTAAIAVGGSSTPPTPEELAEAWPNKITPQNQKDRSQFFQLQAKLWQEYRNLYSLPRVKYFGSPMKRSIGGGKTRYIYTPAFFEIYAPNGHRLPPPSLTITIDVDDAGVCKGFSIQGAS